MPLSSSTRTALVGSLLALCATLAWSGNFIAAKSLSPNLSFIAMVFWRWVVASFCMLPLALGDLIKHWPTVRENLGRLAFYGFLGMCLANLFYYKAPETASAVNMVILAAIAPLFMIFMARVLFGEPITGQRLAGSLLALAGVATLVTGGNIFKLAGTALTPGDFWTLAGAACFSLYSLTLRYFKARLPVRVFLLCVFFFGFLWSVPVYIWSLWGDVHGNFVNPFLPPMRDSLLYISIAASCFAFLCWNAAIARIGAVRAGIIYYLLPVFGAVEAVLILDETVSAGQITGGAMVLGGVVLSSLPIRELMRSFRAGGQAGQG